jgi:hypothetical protein
MSESALQLAVIEFLGLSLCQPAAFFAVPNNPRNAVAGHNAKALGLRKGAPDLMIFAQGKTLGIELETPGGRVAPEQAVMLDLMRQCGVFTAVCRSIEEVEAALINAGIKIKARAA